MTPAVPSSRRSPFDKLRASGSFMSARAEPVEARAATSSSIRRARPSDAAACAAIMRASIRALPAGDLPTRTRAAWASLPALYHRWAMGPGGEVYLVAARAGRLVGYAALRADELTAAFVRPRAQGAGIGRALVAAAAALAGRSGVRRLRVLAARPAVGFYAALGFRGTAAARVPLPGGVALEAVRMRLALEP